MEQNKFPLVSVVVLSYNNTQYLKDCILSVLNQDYPNIEIIVSDDGSKEFNKEKITRLIENNRDKKLNSYIINVNELNLGTSKNFNKCLSLAKGEYVKFIAADDLFYSDNALSKLVRTAINENSNVVIARSPNYDMYLERKEWIYPSDYHWNLMREAAYDDKMFFSIMSPYCLISAPSVLYNKNFLLNMGGADERYRIIEDWPLWLKMIRLKIPFTFLNEPVVVYRSGGVSNGKYNESYAYHQIEFADVIANECLKFPNNFYSKKMYKLAVLSERRHRRDGKLALSDTNKSKIVLYLRYFDIYIRDFLDKISNYKDVILNKKRSVVMYAIVTLTLGSLFDIESLINMISKITIYALIISILKSILYLFGYTLLALGIISYIISFYSKIRSLAR